MKDINQRRYTELVASFCRSALTGFDSAPHSRYRICIEKRYSCICSRQSHNPVVEPWSCSRASALASSTHLVRSISNICSQPVPFLATRAGSNSISWLSRDGLVFVDVPRDAKFLLGPKSGLGPGARDGNVVALGMNAEEVMVEGREMGRLYRCFNALHNQHDGTICTAQTTHAAQEVRLPILLNVHSLPPSLSGVKPAPREMVSCISSSGTKPHGLLDARTTALKACMSTKPSLVSSA